MDHTEREAIKLFSEPLDKDKLSSLYNRVLLTNVHIKAAYELGCPVQQLVCILQHQYEQAVKRILELDSIAPRRYKLPDGRSVVWHAPDSLIPELSLEDD